MKKILIRIDDVCPTMNNELFGYAVEKLRDNGCTALLGVIPNNKDEDLYIEDADTFFWDRIKKLQQQGFTIAMHGYEHCFDIKARGSINNGFKSEFAGHSYKDQYEKIKNGKKLLESHGIFTDVFFAPAHSYDDNTIKALAANDFRYISDGKSNKPYVKYGVKSLPCRSGGISSMRIGQYHVAVIHTHEWTRPDKEIEKIRFDRLLKESAESIVSFEEYKQWRPGSLFWQTINERAYVYYERFIKPGLVMILKKIMFK